MATLYVSSTSSFSILCLLVLWAPPVLGINFTQCASNIESEFSQTPSNTFLVQQDGTYTSNLSSAWGIRYDDCNRLCGTNGSWERFDWNFFSSSFSSWLLPYLALTAQMPYEAKDTRGNFMILFITLGSPMLVVYSLVLTITNTRWINRSFQQLRDDNKETGGEWIEAIAAAGRCLVEGQHLPIQVFQGPQRELAHLIVLPQNRSWWIDLYRELKKTKRPWTYSLFAQIFWVCLAQILTIAVFLKTASTSSSIGLGLAINSLWVWMIPTAFGWVCVGTQTSSGAFQAAMLTVTPSNIGSTRVTRGKTFGVKVRTTCANPSWLEQVEEVIPVSESAVPDINTTRTNINATKVNSISVEGDSKDMKLLRPRCEGTAKIRSTPELPRESMKYTIFDFSIAGCEHEPGSVYNYARLWTHRIAVSHVIDGFRELNARLEVDNPRTVHGRAWDSRHRERNFQGSPTELSRYISSGQKSFDTDHLPVYSGTSTSFLRKVPLAACLAALGLQWGTTGGAILIAYMTPTVGLGCYSGTYLLYGSAATLSCLLLVASSYLSHIWNSCSEKRPSVRMRAALRLVGLLAVLTRILGKCVAVFNASWVVIASTLHFTKFFDNCWCQSDVLGMGPVNGWVVLFATDAQVADASSLAWSMGIVISLVSVGLMILLVIFGRGHEMNRSG